MVTGGKATMGSNKTLTALRKFGVVITFLFVFQVEAAGSWNVTMDKNPIKALVGEDVTIPCYIYGYPTPLNLQKVDVVWTLKSPNTTVAVYTVYILEGSKHTASRLGSQMADSDLINGNASLYIPQVQISDDGEYNCSVFMTPYNRLATTSLQVSVKPQVTLSPPEISVSSQCEKSVTCEVTKFYPEYVKIRWERYNEGSGGQTLLNESTCLTEPVKNDDGTYNITSVLPVRPHSLRENGDVYSCSVTHRSLENDLSQNVTLTVLRNEPSYIPVYLQDTMLSVLTILTILIVFGLLKLYMTFIRKASPQLIHFTPHGTFVHNARLAIHCDILKLCPSWMDVTVYMKKISDSEKQHLCSWDSTSGLVRYDCNDQPLTSSKNNPETYNSDYHRLNVEMVSFLSEVFSDIYKCSFTVYITLDKEKENGAELIVEVKDPTPTSPIFAKFTLMIN